MPSGHKKRKFLKQKNKSSVPPPYQGNGTKGKEKHDIPEKEEVGTEDRENDSIFEFKGGVAASASEMDTPGNEGSGASTIATAGIPSEAQNFQKFDVLKMMESDKSADELQGTEKSQLFESNEFSEESVTSDAKVGWTGELEEKGSEDKDMKEVEMDNSLKEVITPLVKEYVPLTEQVKEYVPVTEEGEARQAAAKIEEVIFAHEVYVSACEKEDKVMIDSHGSMEARQDCERDAIMPKIEISHPPLVVRRASVWNCCGLLEIFVSSER